MKRRNILQETSVPVKPFTVSCSYNIMLQEQYRQISNVSNWDGFMLNYSGLPGDMNYNQLTSA